MRTRASGSHVGAVRVSGVSFRAMKILVVGAKGGVGRKVVEQALAAGHEVTAFGCAPVALPAAPKLAIREGDVLDAAAVDAAVPGHDVVVSVFGHMKPPDLRE